MKSPCRYCEVYPNWQPPVNKSYCRKTKCKWYYKYQEVKEASSCEKS